MKDMRQYHNFVLKSEGYKKVDPSDTVPSAPHTAAPRAKVGELLALALSSQ